MQHRPVFLVFAILAYLVGCQPTPEETRPNVKDGVEASAAPIEVISLDRWMYGGLPHTSGHEDLRWLRNEGYFVGYSEGRKLPAWVAYRLDSDCEDHSFERLDRFGMDHRTVARVVHDDYTNSGYDRGHMAPSAAIGDCYGKDAQDETYMMSNVAPQLPTLNQETWVALEDRIARVYAPELGPVWVFVGPIVDSETVFSFCNGVEIPEAFFMVITTEHQGTPTTLAVIMEQDVTGERTLDEFDTTVDQVEVMTGLDFFPDLPDDLEAAMESEEAAEFWALDEELIPPFDGRLREFGCQENFAR